MITFEELNSFVIDNLLDRVANDGGDLKLLELSGNIAHFGVYAECAVCPACNDNFIWWLENEINNRFGSELSISIEKFPAYFGS